MTLRGFQQEIVELAREHNVVMVGATGIGKTFVAIALLSEQDYSDGRRAFFLAPTRQLVWQITAKIRASSTLCANAYGGSKMEQWGDREWISEWALTRVFVCTPEILRAALERGFVSMDNINLLVFDECHHVTKRHPYAHIMKMYDPMKRDTMPRVFGATACPTRDCAKNLYAKLHKVELQQHETATFAGVAPIQFETYEKEDPVVDNNNISVEESDDGEENKLENWMRRQFRDSVCAPLLDRLAEVNAVTVLDKLLRKGRSDAACNDNRREKVLNKFVLTSVEMYKNWGIWCVYRYIELEIERAAQSASLLYCPGTMYGFDQAAIATIRIARRRRAECSFASSKRLMKIVQLLREHTEDESEIEQLDNDSDESTESRQGIIFVTTRAECRVLYEYLNEKMGYDDAAESDPTRFGCLLGQAGCFDTASSNLPKMEETLLHFERGSIQFLVSTSVSIEGVDFPQCALIVVADRIPSSRKLIQLGGRARHKDGIVYYLAEEGDFNHRAHFMIMKVEADAINTLDFSHDKYETILQQPRSMACAELAGYDFVPAETRITIPSTGAVLDLDSSVSRLNMFCQTLPSQLFTIDFKKMYTFIEKEVMRRPMFRAQLQLPVELDAPRFETELMHSKSLAKAAAAFLGCKFLLEKRLLDGSLSSVYRKGR